MEPARWSQVEAALSEALRLPREERSDFLRRWCRDDVALLREVESLLQHDREESTPSPGELLRSVYGGVPLAPGAELGSYRILRVLGAGGMGVVYLAEQRAPRRQVALKVIAPGRSSPEALRRFALEGEALGKLDHPAIARIFEAGTATLEGESASVPFLAMEYVEGVHLREHLVRAEPPLRQRVELVAVICEALQHAHANGVIHRDLKPQNILVDGQGRPRVVDFGLARLLGDAADTVSETGGLLGTVAYMSPEQCQGDARRVDSRADVHALGIVLYEACTGRSPFAGSEHASPIERLRSICESAPPPLGQANPACRGDLEIIAAHALEKAPEQRYQTAAELGGDLRRWLAHQPISVRAPGVLYRLGRWVRRRRAGAAAIATLAVAAVAIGTVLLDAQVERYRFQVTTNEFFDALLAPDPSWQRGMSYEDLLMRVAAQIDPLVGANDALRAALHERVGVAFWGLASHAQAVEHLRRSYELLRHVRRETDRDLLRISNVLGDVLQETGAHEEAEGLARTWLARCRRHFGDDHEQTLRFATNLADTLAASGRHGAARSSYRELVERAQRVLDESHPDRPEIINSYARVLLVGQEWQEAEAQAREALRLQLAAQGPANPGTLRARTTLGRALFALDRLEEAAVHLEDAEARLRETHAAHHPDTVDARVGLGALRQRQGRGDEVRTLPGVSRGP